MTRLEQEDSLRNHAYSGNLEGIRAILDNPCPDFNINSTDSAGCSALFIALSQKAAAKNRHIIDLLLANGALVMNGSIITPSKTPKMLTRHANAKNLEVILQSLLSQLDNKLKNGLMLEIGSGDGYLKYLLTLPGNPSLEDFKDRIVETEISNDVVANNLANGKFVINSGVADLFPVFGPSCFSCVISMNVLDTFTQEELVANLRTIAGVMKPGGIVLHIMSSAIHENVFSELQNRFPDYLPLPYRREGHIGLRMIKRDNPWIIKNQISPLPVRYWFDLFAQNSGKYIELADMISGNMPSAEMRNQNTILFKDFFNEKIKAAFKAAGYEFSGQRELTSEVTVVNDEYHARIPDTNYFHNILGALFTDYFPPGNMKPGQVTEKSTFLWVMAKWRG